MEIETSHARPARVVLLAHGHPDYSTGGAEMAAYSLFRALRISAPSDTFLIAAISTARARGQEGSRLVKTDDSEFEWSFITEGTTWPYHEAQSIGPLKEDLIPFIKGLDPDVVHLHHYLGFGVDVIRMIRHALPRTRIVFTLHEYLAICTRDGQMLTAPGNTLCSKASPIRCTGCFPELLRAQVWMREHWFKRAFELVDVFTSPSEFLACRYIDWGIPQEKMVVLENAQIAATQDVISSVGSETGKLVFAYFGQINPYKGVELLLTAAARLRELTSEPFEIQIHGVIKDHDPAFKERVESLLQEMEDVVTFRGPYDADRVIPLMQASDYVLVPSIWWENSPVVIEEAFHAGRPVICADIGGMKEKVANEVNGLHFRARDPESLAKVLLRCIRDLKLAEVLREGVRKVPTLAESDRDYRAVYTAKLAMEINPPANTADWSGGAWE